jgi:NADH-quinone oxidoreductase subunit G
MPTVKINGQEVVVPDGVNMIEAAAQLGVEIPHYCYHPHLSIAGNCRMCLVDIEAGGRGPDIACNMKARDGLAIRTDTAQVKQMRKSVMEFLLANHPLDCPICDQAGECRLQDYYMDYGQYESRLVDAKVAKPKRQDIGDHIVLDSERCVACSRCVRFGDEVTKTGELRLFNRTDHTEIGIFPGERLKHQYQGVLADICPVGALTNKDFRFAKRVWYLKETESVCNGCATGCNIFVCHENGGVFRYLPRRNDAVNKSWMCDVGRADYAEVNSTRRMARAQVGGKPVTVDAAVQAALNLLRSGDPAQVAVVFGAQATNEANFGLLRIVQDLLPRASIYICEGNNPGASAYHDQLLVSPDKNPNSVGARVIAATKGDVGSRSDLIAGLKGGSIKVVLVLEDDVLGRLKLDSQGARIVYVGAWRNDTAAAAEVVLPAAHSVEQDGSFTNADGRAQRLRRSVLPLGDSLPAWQLLDKLAAAMGRPLGFSMGAVAFKRLAEGVPAFAGLSYQSLGGGGAALPKSALSDSETFPTEAVTTQMRLNASV